MKIEGWGLFVSKKEKNRKDDGIKKRVIGNYRIIMKALDVHV